MSRAALLSLAGLVAAFAMTGCETFFPSDDASSRTSSPGLAGSSSGTKSVDAAAGSGLDIDAFLDVYDGTLPATYDGRELIALLERFGDEIAARERLDEPLLAMGYAVVDAWDAPVRAFLDGDGAQTAVTQPMVDSLDVYLTRLAMTTSSELAMEIASERKVRPPLQSLVGLDLVAFDAALFPSDRMFRDDFE